MIKSNSLRMTTFFVLLGCYSLIVGSLLAYKNFNLFINQWTDYRSVIVYLKNDISTEDLNKIQKKLKSEPDIESVKYISHEAAISSYEKQLGSIWTGFNEDQELLNLVPSSFEVHLKPSVSAMIAQVAESISHEIGVEEVSYGKDWLNHFQVLVRVIQSTLTFVAIFILGASLFVISNMIRTHVFRKKEEIEVLEMLGASPAMIRAPFLKESFFMGGGAVLLALLINWFIFDQFKNYILLQYPFSVGLQSLHFMNGTEVFALVFIGSLMSVLGSYWSVSGLNTGQSSLYRWVEM